MKTRSGIVIERVSLDCSFYRYRRLDRTFSSSIIPALAGEFEI